MKSTQKPLAYHAPQVVDYGNVKQITMAHALGGNSDGGTVILMKMTA